ncbi:MAG TPA: protein kinase [Kofleriaceae bacterium]|nr:protein kinase [Kofleriaceae bacterium]
MTDAAASDVQWLCPSCDHEPPLGLEEPVCPACGAKLIEVRSRAKDMNGVVIDGRFEIRDLVGEGGMGAVYRAWQRSIGREVAIKLIDDRHGRDPMAVRRFLREARLASQLSQPNTVSVIDFGQSNDGRLFIAMELIRGKTLADLLDRDGPFPATRAAWIGVQLCDALDAAHRLQIVHRDLKPANVVILDDPPGRDLLKVLDFGLAKSLTESETKATDTGLVVGTPRYMAPEVVMGEAPTPQSDLYAVGVILGELSTGKVLWEATSFPALAGQKMHVSPIIDEVPPGLRSVVARLLDPDPARRPATASEVRNLLRPLVNSDTPIPFTGPARALHDTMPAPTGQAPAATTTPNRKAPAPAADPTVPLLEIATPPPRKRAAQPQSQALTLESTADSLGAVPAGSRRGGPIALLALAVLVAVVGGILVATLGRGGRSGNPGGVRDDNDPGGGTASGTASGGTPSTGTGSAPAPDASVAGTPGELLDAAPVPARSITLTIRSKPPGARITVDGQPAGIAPVEWPVPFGTQAIAVEAESGGRVTRQNVVPDRDRTMTLTIRRPTSGTDRGGGLPF